METVLPQQPANPDNLPVVANQVSSPFAEEYITLSKEEHIELTCNAKYWQSQHARTLDREAALKERVAELEAEVRDLKQRLYGKKSEKSGTTKNEGSRRGVSTRPRGQQPGSAGHGRTKRPHLPVTEEVRDVEPQNKHCPKCGKPHVPFGSEDSEIVEVQVRPFIRRVKRKRYVKGCQCAGTPSIITAPPAPRVIPKSDIGVSVWVMVLLDKYLYSRPTHRLGEDLKYHGLPIAQGTLTGGLKRIANLLEPLVAAMYDKQMSECLFNGDETGWKVFEAIEGKVGYRWYLWVVRSASVVYYRMDPGRSAQVPKEHFANLDEQLVEVILVCDRYTAYKKLAKDLALILLAFCWAHVRRDFLDAARSWPELDAWALDWVERIGMLYHINNQRIEVWDETKPLDAQGPVFLQYHSELCEQLDRMQAHYQQELKEPELHSIKEKVLTSLKNHWLGLTVFVDHPAVPMDNNKAERSVRGPVTGRKNYYGSGSVWSAELAAMMFTMFQSILLWGINPKHWLQLFLQACADNGGRTPADLSPFLPWEMSEQRRQQLSQPLPTDDATIIQAETTEPECIDSS